jgi:dihydroxyacetone kinase-like protein
MKATVHAVKVSVDARALQAFLSRWCDAMEAAAPELNALDARLGDGDLGTTLSRCAANVRPLATTPAQDLLSLFKACAQACAKASGSSFGTLLAQGFLSAAKSSAGRQVLDRAALATMLAAAGDALSARGGAVPGDKTMLDSLQAIQQALQALRNDADGDALKKASAAAAAAALDAFRDRPNRIGRARMFAERSIGLDDPGMVAVQRMTGAL